MVIHYPRSTLAERREQGRDAQQTNKTVEANNIDAQRETYTPPNGYHYRWNPPAAQEKHLIPTQSSDAALISFIRGETTFDDLSRALFEKD